MSATRADWRNMPRRIKITREMIVDAATKTVRAFGTEALNARSLAAMLDASTQPIFSNFRSMDEVLAAVKEEAKRLYAERIERFVSDGKYPNYKCTGLAYVSFATEERELFKLLFMRDREGEATDDVEHDERVIHPLSEMLGTDMETARLFHLEMWSLVHGVAVLQTTNYLPLSLELVSKMLSDVYRGLLYSLNINPQKT